MQDKRPPRRSRREADLVEKLRAREAEIERLRGRDMVVMAELEATRDALQRYVDGDGCEYADDPPECPGDASEGVVYVVECRWHQARRVLARPACYD